VRGRLQRWGTRSLVQPYGYGKRNLTHPICWWLTHSGWWGASAPNEVTITRPKYPYGKHWTSSRNLTLQHPQVAQTLSMLAHVSFMRGQYPDTERQVRQALAINEEVLGPDHMVTGMAVDGLGTLYRYWGRNQEAAAQFQRALAILSDALEGVTTLT
jgi:Tetratricopeptide repeat